VRVVPGHGGTARFRLRGDVAKQTDSGAGAVNNNPQSLRNFDLGDYRSDYGAHAEVGDGFAGAMLDYYQLGMNTSGSGTLDDDFGSLPAGSTARMSATMDERRVGWLQPVWREQAEVRGAPLDLRLALGAFYTYRKLAMHMTSTTTAVREDPTLKGDLIYPALRFRAGWGPARLDVDYAISPDLVLRGDFGGLQHDFEAKIAYVVPFQDVTLFAGWRYSTMEGDDVEAGLRTDADLVLDGFQFGVQVSF
jgi:hypothetical protein